MLAGQPEFRLRIYFRYQLYNSSAAWTYLPGNFDLTSIDNHAVKNVDDVGGISWSPRLVQKPTIA